MCRDEGRRGLEAETDAEVIESENWKLNIEENVVGLPLWKGKEAWFFLVPEGRFSGGQEGDSWWDENSWSRASKPLFSRVLRLFSFRIAFWLHFFIQWLCDRLLYADCWCNRQHWLLPEYKWERQLIFWQLPRWCWDINVHRFLTWSVSFHAPDVL